MFWIEVENVINSANDVLSEPMDKPIAHLNQVSGEIFVWSNCGSIKTRVISTSSWSRQCLVRSALPGAAAAPRVAAAPGSETPCRSRYTVARWSWAWSLSHDHDVDPGCPGGASPWEAPSKAGRAERRAWRRESRQQVQQHHNPTNWKNADLCPTKSCAPLPLF